MTRLLQKKIALRLDGTAGLRLCSSPGIEFNEVPLFDCNATHGEARTNHDDDNVLEEPKSRSRGPTATFKLYCWCLSCFKCIHRLGGGMRSIYRRIVAAIVSGPTLSLGKLILTYITYKQKYKAYISRGYPAIA